jgi:hypothetical protein
VASAGIGAVLVFAFYSLYSISPCGRQYRIAKNVSGAACCRRNACIVMASCRAVNEKSARSAVQNFEQVEKFCSRCLFFWRCTNQREIPCDKFETLGRFVWNDATQAKRKAEER